MSEDAPTGSNTNGTSTSDSTAEAQQPARRAIITNAHVLQRGANHGEHSGDEVSEDEGPEPEVIANDEGISHLYDGYQAGDWWLPRLQDAC